jgi:hypothetical protein
LTTLESFENGQTGGGENDYFVDALTIARMPARRASEAPPVFPIVPDKPSVRPVYEANGASTPALLPVSILHAGPAVQLGARRPRRF